MRTSFGLFVLLLVISVPGHAELCTVDSVPAATLLLPYFEVDLEAPDGTGVNTLFSINNASASPALAHVTMWTDWSIPVLDFDVFLTGFDIVTISLGEILLWGNLPVTADEQSDQGQTGRGDPCVDGVVDSCSPHAGPNSGNPVWDGSFTGALGGGNCIDFFPFFINPLIAGQRQAELQAALTGQPTPSFPNCAGADHGDNVARGYVTVDSVNGCSIDFPNDPAYFTDGVNPGTANNANVLWGDYFLVDPANNAAAGAALVHVEAEDGFTGAATGYTFYGRYTSALGTQDNREPLGESWAVRYLEGAGFDGGTDLVVWRDSTSADLSSRACGAPGVLGVGPSWQPLNETEVIAFDEDEDAVQLCTGGGGGGVISPPLPDSPDPACFPLESQRVSVGEAPFSPSLAPPHDSGWLFLNLNVGDDSPEADYDPGAEGTLAQSHVSVVYTALGRLSVGLAAIELTSACAGSDPQLAPLYDIPTHLVP